MTAGRLQKDRNSLPQQKLFLPARGLISYPISLRAPQSTRGRLILASLGWSKYLHLDEALLSHDMQGHRGGGT